MKRRDFLDTGQAVHAAGQLIGPWLDLGGVPPGPEASAVSLLRFSRRAMATTFEMLLPYGKSSAAEIASEVFELIDALESQMTVYRDDGEIAHVNRRAADEAVAVEARLFDLLALAARITAETSGAFDITSGPLIKAWGFFRRQGRVPTPGERQAALECVGMRHVELKPDQRTVRFRRSGVEINLASIGKGYAIDRGVEQLRARGVRSALLHAGGSSVFAVGDQPGSRRGWPVSIRHPWRDGRGLGLVHLRDRALATSAATYQHFEYNKRKLGHLLDPRSGWPADAIASASVVAPTAAEADALATAFFVLGVDRTRLYCQTHPEIGAILLPTGDDARPVVLGMSPDEFAFAAV